MSSKTRVFCLFVILLLCLVTRFWGLNWGGGHFPHPDENNMAIAVSKLSFTNLNPEFFAYGQFPLYLARLSLYLVRLSNTFVNSVYALRFWSATFSCLSILIFYLISRYLFKKPFQRLIFILFLIFTPGLIQLAHFGTTESLLILVFATNLLLAFSIFNSQNPHQLIAFLFLSSLNTGIGLASKISSLIFIFPVLLSLLLVHRRNKLFLLLVTSYYLLFTLCFFVLLSPYSIIKRSEFLGSMKYETAVATGRDKVFYTNQYLATPPYLFQLTKIFPYTSGLPMFAFGLLGLVLLITNKKWPIILLSTFLYYLYFGSLYAKWTRFMSPIFFVFPLLVTYLISKLNNLNKNIFFTLLNKFIIMVSVIPGVLFMRLYFQPDIRVTASRWLDTYLPAHSTILTESGNVTDIPYTNKKNHQISSFDFYNLDSNQELIDKLPQLLEKNDYILVPSRRMFKNQMRDRFPYSNEYYTRLFSGDYGFIKIKEFRPQVDFLLNSENAEETWSVFDHPTIRVYKKI